MKICAAHRSFFAKFIGGKVKNFIYIISYPFILYFYMMMLVVNFGLWSVYWCSILLSKISIVIFFGGFYVLLFEDFEYALLMWAIMLTSPFIAIGLNGRFNEDDYT